MKILQILVLLGIALMCLSQNVNEEPIVENLNLNETRELEFFNFYKEKVKENEKEREKEKEKPKSCYKNIEDLGEIFEEMKTMSTVNQETVLKVTKNLVKRFPILNESCGIELPLIDTDTWTVSNFKCLNEMSTLAKTVLSCIDSKKGMSKFYSCGKAVYNLPSVSKCLESINIKV